MMRKLISTLTISLMIIILSFSGFAMDNSIDWDKSIEIISPEIDSNDEVLIMDGELLINIRLNGNISTNMSMYDIGEPLEVDDIYLSEHESLSRFLLENPKNTELSEEAISQVEDLDEEELIDLYNQSEDDLSKLSDDIKSMYIVIDFIMLKDEENLTDTDKENISKFDEMLVSYFEKKLEYEYVVETYNKEIKDPVFEDVEVKLEGFLPYYQMEVDGLVSSNYELVFTDNEGNIVKTQEFSVVSEEIAKEDLIEEDK